MRFKYLLFFFIVSCNQTVKETSSTFDNDLSNDIRYAKGFSIDYYKDITRLTVKEPFKGAGTGLTYWIIPKTRTVPDSLQSRSVIRTPLEEVVVTSTSHIPMLEYLGETEALTGFPSLDYISSEKMRARIDAGKVAELGRDNALNFEMLVDLQPDLVMTYMLNGDRSQLDRIESAGIPILINADYLEQHPLGRAEWIKVAGLLFGKEDEADSIYSEIARKYETLKQQVSQVQKPTVMTGIMYGDTWYIPGGNNYAARLFADAGFNYLWKDDNSSGFLQLSFETVYDKARSADFWIGTASFNDLSSLGNADTRYTWFEPYREGNVYSYTKRMGPKGGNEYLELGYLRPDIILADLIQIGHPGLQEDRELFFYEKVESRKTGDERKK